MLLFADVETTTLNKGHPFNPNNFLVSYALIGNCSRFGYYTEPDFVSVLREEMGQATCYINFAMLILLVSSICIGSAITGLVSH